MPTQAKSISVSDLNRQVKSLLEHSLGTLRVSGEISNFVRPSSGHWYFTLKDKNAQVRCAMFRGNNLRANFKPSDGDQVVVSARVSLYEGRGDYQLICERIEKDGEGELQRAFDALKRKLADEGLFDASRKQALPSAPRSIGVITSESGAALHDILTVLSRRAPGIDVYLYPSAVQGKAADDLIKAIRLAEKHGTAEVLIIGRGGGSLEDLWPFNDEQLARAIAQCKIPIVSAVGHEIDFSISDFVADARAPTPSAAAELLSPDQQEVRARLTQLNQALIRIWRQQISRQRERLNATRLRLRHPGERLIQRRQRVDELELRLRAASERQILASRAKLEYARQRLERTQPERLVLIKREQLKLIAGRMKSETLQLIERRRIELRQQVSRLQDISPLSTLERGYALATSASGAVLRSSKQIQPGERVHIRLSQGGFTSEVTQLDEE